MATPTHTEIGRTFVTKNCERLMFTMGEWYEYQGGVWNSAKDLQIEGEIWDHLESYEKQLNDFRPTSSIKNSVLSYARARLCIPESIIDAYHHLINFTNGIFNVTDGMLYPHSPSYYITTQLPFDYDAAAVPNSFLFALSRIDPETVRFLQEYYGYSCTTDTKYEMAVWIKGPAGGGKSTLIEGAKAMLGKKYGLLGLADIERNRFALKDIPGKTLMLATEQPSDYISATHILNSLISGEPIMVERKFKDAQEVTPKCKLLWAMNEMPRIGNANNGIFRRVKVVDIPALKDDEKEEDLKEAIKGEGAGIFNWALEGLRRLQARGKFEIPLEVARSTKAFVDDNDIPKQFIDEACKTGPDCEVKGPDLYEAYRAWCTQTGHKPQAANRIADEWRRLGYQDTRTTRKGWTGRWWDGLQPLP